MELWQEMDQFISSFNISNTHGESAGPEFHKTSECLFYPLFFLAVTTSNRWFRNVPPVLKHLESVSLLTLLAERTEMYNFRESRASVMSSPLSFIHGTCFFITSCILKKERERKISHQRLLNDVRDLVSENYLPLLSRDVGKIVNMNNIFGMEECGCKSFWLFSSLCIKHQNIFRLKL